MALRSEQASEALIQYEAGQEHVAAHAMTDSGDNTTFAADESPWSGRAGYEPVIRPNGIITGGDVTPGSTNDTVDVAKLNCYLAGVEVDVSASSDESLTRATTDTHIINSVTIDKDGAIQIIDGSEGDSFSSTRGGNGGPPWIPTDSIEIAQVKLSSQDAAAVTASEIYQIDGASRERYMYPIWSEDFAKGEITFATALPESHSDDSGSTTATKEVYAEVYTPIFANAEPTSDFVPPEETHSLTSTQVYGGTVASASTSLNQGSFTYYAKDGVTDSLIGLKNLSLWFKFYPHRLRDPYLLAQGKLGISRSYPAGDAMTVECTVSASGPVIEMAE